MTDVDSDAWQVEFATEEDYQRWLDKMVDNARFVVMRKGSASVVGSTIVSSTNSIKVDFLLEKIGEA